EKMLNKFHQISGINNHMGSLFTEHAEKLAPVMDILRRRGLFFLDSKTSAKSVAKQVAADYAVAYAHRHVFLDNTNEKDYVLKQLALTERIARRNGYAVAIGHPKHATFLALKEWLPTLKQKNIKMLPLSQVVKILNPHISYLH
ncbi:MAG: divergent polysaccharide deacetylase family protein, partial [Alphaproteobacteria bacterium]|nr:divergent polysaccharide deacetylase family protein [Alphaproteobacteria bacterium]